MPTHFSSRKQFVSKERAQAIVEFAIVLPILMMLLVGILEVGRMVFIFAAVNNASREAARYASAVGLADGNVYNKFQYCSEIRNVAKRSAFLVSLADSDIDINYDDGPASVSTPFDTCPVGVVADTSIAIDSGDRVTITVRTTYNPMVNLIPISSRNIESISSRTMVGIYELPSDPGVAGSGGAGGSGGGGGGGGGGGSSATSTPTRTPTPTATHTPTITPTATIAPVATFTSTPTAKPGCGSVTADPISMANNSNVVSMKITNPHSSFTVTNIQFQWNAATGAPGNKKLNLQQAQLGTFLWTGSDGSGSYSNSPSSTLPGNNSSSTIIFTFDKNYQNPVANGTTITLTLSSTDCGTFSITQTK